jgi:hypothetical protein
MAVLTSLFYDAMLTYGNTKHNLTEAKIGEKMMDHLESYLKSHKLHQRATVVKLIQVDPD